MRGENRTLVHVRLGFSESHLVHPFSCLPVLIPLEEMPNIKG